MTLTIRIVVKVEARKKGDNFTSKKIKMYDEEIQSNSEGEQGIYEKFLEWLHIRQFIDKLGDTLDEMQDDNLNDNQE